MPEKNRPKPKLYELEPETVVASLKSGKLQGIGGDPENTGSDRIVISPPNLGYVVYLDIKKYIEVLNSQGYDIIEGFEVLENLTPMSDNIVLERKSTNPVSE